MVEDFLRNREKKRGEWNGDSGAFALHLLEKRSRKSFGFVCL